MEVRDREDGRKNNRPACKPFQSGTSSSSYQGVLPFAWMRDSRGNPVGCNGGRICKEFDWWNSPRVQVQKVLHDKLAIGESSKSKVILRKHTRHDLWRVFRGLADMRLRAILVYAIESLFASLRT